MSFTKIIGLDRIVNLFRDMCHFQEIPSSLILTGMSGTGKTTLARSLAMYANCLTPGRDACLKCINCRKIHPTYGAIELDSALNSGIEDVKSVISISRYQPIGVRYRFFILDEVHMLSYAAQSALLKTLEESNVQNKFILITTNIEKLQVGILTRSVALQTTVLEGEDIDRIVRKIHPDIDEDNLALIRLRSQGMARYAIQAARLSRILRGSERLSLFLEGVNPEVWHALWDALILRSNIVLRRFKYIILQRYSSKDQMLGDCIDSVSAYIESAQLPSYQLAEAVIDIVNVSQNMTKSAILSLVILNFLVIESRNETNTS